MNRWQKISILLGAIGVIDFAIAGGGLLTLYWTGFPSEKMVPQPITAAVLHGGVMFMACLISCAFHGARKGASN